MLSVNAIKALAHTVEKNSDAPLSVYIYIYILSRQFVLSINHGRLAQTIKRNSNVFFSVLICTHTHIQLNVFMFTVLTICRRVYQ